MEPRAFEKCQMHFSTNQDDDDDDNNDNNRTYYIVPCLSSSRVHRAVSISVSISQLPT